jgi:hypothetical protein
MDARSLDDVDEMCFRAWGVTINETELEGDDSDVNQAVEYVGI